MSDCSPRSVSCTGSPCVEHSISTPCPARRDPTGLDVLPGPPRTVTVHAREPQVDRTVKELGAGRGTVVGVVLPAVDATVLVTPVVIDGALVAAVEPDLLPLRPLRATNPPAPVTMRAITAATMSSRRLDAGLLARSRPLAPPRGVPCGSVSSRRETPVPSRRSPAKWDRRFRDPRAPPGGWRQASATTRRRSAPLAVRSCLVHRLRSREATRSTRGGRSSRHEYQGDADRVAGSGCCRRPSPGPSAAGRVRPRTAILVAFAPNRIEQCSIQVAVTAMGARRSGRIQTLRCPRDVPEGRRWLA
jgi:hypothetical protein